MTAYVKSSEVSDEIYRRISSITKANGFETDIGLSVKRGRRKLPAEDEIPCAVIIEGPDDVEDMAGKTQSALIKVRQAYVIDGFDTCDPEHPNDTAHAIIRDIKRAIFSDGRTFGGKVSEVLYTGRDIGPRPDGAAFVQARVMIDASFAENLATP
jgi:hypothetical protein